MQVKHVMGVALGAAVLATTLAGCTASASVYRTVSPDSFESTVVKALQKISDATPEVDCGDDDIALKDGAKVHCDVNTKGYDVVYDSVVTISTKGTESYSVHVEVDDQPKS
ncbi:hypothetical protein [Curtobacterium herbarum]|uniref:DUF4333 domain-containing protein n=1 Tax=Curtobacterium herbarum TaxID=150122 RepID=A0ABP4JZ94_9MICO|nr:hypothetical protein [Curtobacterium herbarum]MBM7476512.1 hypothetical protein [Curtobacterium herbarum]MCS6543925.1 hypothetical protein [Curtobacterium herbarum]